MAFHVAPATGAGWWGTWTRPGAAGDGPLVAAEGGASRASRPAPGSTTPRVRSRVQSRAHSTVRSGACCRVLAEESWRGSISRTSQPRGRRPHMDPASRQASLPAPRAVPKGLLIPHPLIPLSHSAFSSKGGSWSLLVRTKHSFKGPSPAGTAGRREGGGPTDTARGWVSALDRQHFPRKRLNTKRMRRQAADPENLRRRRI